MENNKNMTAVEWLIETINDGGGFIFTSHYEKLFKQAKQMEKEQMIEFTNKVLDNTIGDLILLYPVEKIYNETYGKENSN